MPLRLYDAHNHWSAETLSAWSGDIDEALCSFGVVAGVVNGTHPGDWEAVLQYCRTRPGALPAVGLHPRQVESAPASWKTTLLAALDDGAQAIGEIGLDGSQPCCHPSQQEAAFVWQMHQARERDQPVSVHCLQAIGKLMEILRRLPLPQRGFHLHAYSGPPELIEELADLGAYFSFNGSQFRSGAKKAPLCAREVPLDRLLLESDAPYGHPLDPALRPHTLPESEHSAGPLNHPANLAATYERVAELREITLPDLAEAVEKNFQRLYLVV